MDCKDCEFKTKPFIVHLKFIIIVEIYIASFPVDAKHFQSVLELNELVLEC